MAEVWLWNSIATRKRSPSDGFLENGLALLKAHLKKHGHNVRVIDWQKNEFYKGLCFGWLLSLNRLFTIFIFWLGRKKKIYAKLFFPFFNLLQETVSFVRRCRMKRRLRGLAEEVIKSGIKIFGIKVWYGEAFLWADWLAGYIKRKDPSLLLIAGGFHVTLYEEDFLKNSVFDFGVMSEGEEPLRIILGIADKNLGNWDKTKVMRDIRGRIESGELKNMVYRNAKEVCVTERYIPRMEDKALPEYDEENIQGKLKIHVLLDSLGCPWGRCWFCVHSHFYPKFYPRPVEDIVSEIEYMLKKDVGLFRFAGSETPPGFGVNIAKAVLGKGLKIKYSVGCRAVKGVTDSKERYESVVEDYETMLQAGLRAIFMGGETGNDVINEKVMNKGIVRREITKTAEAYREAQRKTGIHAYLSLALIYPSPLLDGISLDEIFRDNLELIEEMDPESVIVSPCTPFKQTLWYKEKERFGFEIPEDFIEKIMRYEYVLYKPPSLWPPLGDIRINDMNFKEFLEECERLRNTIEGRGIPTDLTDEYFLMIEGAGYSGKEGLERFKKETSIDLVSSDYRNIERITELTNNSSRKLAQSNIKSQPPGLGKGKV